MQTPTPYSPFDPTGENTQYEKLLDVVRARFSALVKDDTPLFTVGTKNLFEAFLSGLPEARRQHYRCNECAHFFRRFGNLVTIDSTGNTHDLWPDADVPPFFRSAVNKVRSKVQSARVSGVFVWPETVWGTPTSLVTSPPFEWHHLYVCAPAGRVFKALATEPYKAIQEARARRAELAEDHRVLTRACNEFRLDTIVTTKAILTSDKAFRGEKVLGVAEWFLELAKAKLAAGTTDQERNLMWRAVATAPAGFAHVRNTMIGTLLTDLQSGYSIEQATKRFNEKMDPLKYQRPTAVPSLGNIEQAEKIIEKLGAERSLPRRFATLDDIRQHALWLPHAPNQTPGKGVFAHLRPTSKPIPKDMPGTTTITWEKFQRTVLPTAENIEFFIQSLTMPFFAFVTAVDPSAPPILQWDTPSARNPVSWYFYRNGSLASAWNLKAQEYVQVTAVTLQPNRWNGGFGHHEDGAYFVLQGARDMNPDAVGGLFVESLKSEYHPVRKTIEAHLAKAKIAGRHSASACGIGLTKDGMKPGNADLRRVRVTANNMRTVYLIDRWD